MSRRTMLFSGAAALVLLLAGLWWLSAPPGGSSIPAAQGAAGPESGVLAVDARRAAQMGIRLAPAGAAEEAPLATIPAMIQPPANARVAVAATFPGTVLRTLVVEGDSVRRGQPLAVIASRDVLTIGADLSRAHARSGVAQANAARLSQLSREGIIAGARADEANAIAAEARADVSEKSRILAMVNGHGGSGSYKLTAPIAGRITSAAIQAGNPVDGTTAPYVIDAADRYEVVGQLPERLIGQVRPGMSVRLLPDLTGRIVAVGSTIDPATRSASLKAEIPAGPGVVAGRATSIVIAGPAPAGAVSVPDAAITMIDGKSMIFVAERGGFAIRPVTSGGTSNGRTVLLSGVRPGEQIVVSGTSALKALATAQ
ncbi:efflux RND transporter periplasmic adaptor subunit [Novosphingobium album (ex Liu et al. 2023)]|uniref:Efflux RND transporter periplasmic adaptor subunit n=1 Tax=Novosphingobium album (ex Liu et al. 2023) TaxID=3031130 RepID=A0ABT5WWH2_9SPHN|nr:efflux RND transporter periplasmic adaptor subunit [Novosphingobium album (ex Liu et al. 2023)]MDE8654229.1 efflux RND transporter periplasmic adaptor subunit [Novosphingobium album (ex Liu et al. 2023)]